MSRIPKSIYEEIFKQIRGRVQRFVFIHTQFNNQNITVSHSCDKTYKYIVTTTSASNFINIMVSAQKNITRFSFYNRPVLVFIFTAQNEAQIYFHDNPNIFTFILLHTSKNRL